MQQNIEAPVPLPTRRQQTPAAAIRIRHRRDNDLASMHPTGKMIPPLFRIMPARVELAPIRHVVDDRVPAHDDREIRPLHAFENANRKRREGRHDRIDIITIRSSAKADKRPRKILSVLPQPPIRIDDALLRSERNDSRNVPETLRLVVCPKLVQGDAAVTVEINTRHERALRCSGLRARHRRRRRALRTHRVLRHRRRNTVTAKILHPRLRQRSPIRRRHGIPRTRRRRNSQARQRRHIRRRQRCHITPPRPQQDVRRNNHRIVR